MLYGDRLLDHGNAAEAEAKYRESLARYRLLGDVNMIAYPLGNLGRLALCDGRLEEAHELISESVRYARGGNRVALGDWLFRLGQVHLYLGELETAAADLNTTLTLYEEINNMPGQASVLACLAEVALANGDVTGGRSPDPGKHDPLPRDLRVDRDDRHLESPHAIQRRHRKHPACRPGCRGPRSVSPAVTLLSCGEAIVAESGYRTVPPLGAKVTTALAMLQDVLSAAELGEATARGRQMSLEELFLAA